MAETTLTVKQIMDLGLWSKVCEYKGWSEWIYNEGRIDGHELVTFDSEFKKEDTNEMSDKERLIKINDRWDNSDISWDELKQDCLWLKDKCNELLELY